MYYIQTVDHNNKKYNFLCTEQEFAFINKEDIYEWKVEDHYLEIRKNNFEEISDFQYELLKKHINFIVFKKLKKRHRGSPKHSNPIEGRVIRADFGDRRQKKAPPESIFLRIWQGWRMGRI